jgi:hypothetical protein
MRVCQRKPPCVGYVKLGNEKRFILTDLERFKEASTVKAA